MNITVTNEDIINGMYNNTCAFTLALQRNGYPARRVKDRIIIGSDSWCLPTDVQEWLGYHPRVFVLGMCERVFNDFITKCLPDLQKAARKLADEDHCDELVGRVLLAATKQQADIDETRFPWTWMTTKLRMEWLYMQRDMVMQKAHYNTVELTATMDESQIEGASWLQQQNHEAPVGMAKDVWEVVATLPQIQQRIIYLTYVEGYTAAEVAELVQPVRKIVRPGDQRKRINRHLVNAHRTLRTRLAAYDNRRQTTAPEKTSPVTNIQSA